MHYHENQGLDTDKTEQQLIRLNGMDYEHTSFAVILPTRSRE